MRVLLVLVGLALAASTFVVVLGTRGGTTLAQPEPANVMSVDAVSGGAIDASRTVTTADPFHVDIDIEHGGSQSLDYSGYEVTLCFDPSVLEFVPATDVDRDTVLESWTYTDLGGLRAHMPLVQGFKACPGQPSITSLTGASAKSGAPTSATGVAATASFRCIGSGTVNLHLLTPVDALGGGTRTSNSRMGDLPTTLADADITCSPPPTATQCPPDVCTPTATPSPAPTPTSTPTPDPLAEPNLMSVDAVSGGDVDSTRQVPTGGLFDVDIHIQHGGSSAFDYTGYQAILCFDSQFLDFLPAVDMTGDTVPESWTYTDLGDMFLQGTTTEWPGSQYCAAAFPDTLLAGGAIGTGGETGASGAAAIVTFACVAPGVSTLHLVGKDESRTLTTTIDRYGVELPTELADATIICLADTDGDRCGDRQELIDGLNPIDPLDFFNVPAPVNPDGEPNGPKNTDVSIQDALAVVQYFGTFDGDGGAPNGNGVAYDTVKGSCPEPFTGDPQKEGLCYDRSPGASGNPARPAGPPNGYVDISDALLALAQFGLDCSEPQ